MILPNAAQFHWLNPDDPVDKLSNLWGVDVVEPEPSLQFNTGGTLLLNVKSSGIFYNTTDFPNDTYKEAALKVFTSFNSTLNYVSVNQPFAVTLKSWGIYPERNFVISTTGIEHNYEIDTWTWWLLNELGDLIKKHFRK